MSFFLTGSIILPLGDFSLMKDLPGMYKSYCKIKAGNPDVIDFIGDYLLGGKDLLGHNQHDAPVKNDGSLQFRHQASLSLFFVSHSYQVVLMTELIAKKYNNHLINFHNSGYPHESFRPPIA